MLQLRNIPGATKNRGRMAKETPASVKGKSTDDDQFPTITEGLRQVLDRGTVLDARVRRLDIRWTAGGHCYYRFWEEREQDFGAGQAPIS